MFEARAVLLSLVVCAVSVVSAQDGGCFKTIAHRGGAIKQILKVGNAEGCQKHCQETENCSFWTLDRRNKCWLNDNTTKVVPNTNGGIGGPRECGIVGGETSYYVCEHKTLSLSCPEGTTIDILTANYGRTEKDKCPSSLLKNLLASTDCKADKSLEIVKTHCDGMGSCTVQAKNSLFGDPCSGTFKYLDVSYTCKKRESSLKLLTSFYQLPCKTPCKTSYYGGKGRHDWCNTDKGWDYCSKERGTDYRGNQCTSTCEKAEEKFNWCRIASGSWGYCSIEDTSAVLNHTCYDEDTDYYGGDIGHSPTVDNAVDCQKLCMATANCQYWTFYNVKGASYGCHVKDRKNTPSTLAGGTSGPRICGDGLDLGVRCNYKSPPCRVSNSACITYRCKCVKDWVRYPRNGNTCVAQDTLELDTPCTNPGSPCSASNSECRAYRCMCKSGFTKSAGGDECDAA